MPERNVWNGVPTANQYTQQDQNTQIEFVINEKALAGSAYKWDPKSSVVNNQPAALKNDSSLLKDFEPQIPDMQQVAYPSRNCGGPRPCKNAFFTRNIPHPAKVRHIRGLNNTPICTVFNARHREKSLMDVQAQQAGGVGLAGMLPNKPLTKVALGNLPRGEKAIPGIGMIQMVPKWLSMLRELTHDAGLRQTMNSPQRTRSAEDVQLSRPSSQPNKSSRSAQRKMENDFVRRTVSQSSERGGDRTASQNALRLPDINEKNGITSARRLPLEDRTNAFGGGQPAPLPFPDSETFVFHVLGNLLDTESVDDIKQWLATSPEDERERVLNVIRRLSEDNLQFRDGMDPLYGPHGGDYRDNLLQHDGCIDRNEIDKFNTEKKLKDEEIAQKMRSDVANYEPPLLRQFDENVNRDIEHGSRQSERAKENAIAEVSNLLGAPDHVDQEVEEIRNIIASRGSSRGVFGAQKTQKVRINSRHEEM